MVEDEYDWREKGGGPPKKLREVFFSDRSVGELASRKEKETFRGREFIEKRVRAVNTTSGEV